MNAPGDAPLEDRIATLRRFAEEAGRDPDSIQMQMSLSPDALNKEERKRFYADPDLLRRRLAEIRALGFGHTSIIHSHDVRNMTKMGRALNTTLFVKNGPCMAGLGLGGEGYISFSIAGPTGEGVTTPLTFTRERRCTMVDDLWILGR